MYKKVNEKQCNKSGLGRRPNFGVSLALPKLMLFDTALYFKGGRGQGYILSLKSQTFQQKIKYNKDDMLKRLGSKKNLKILIELW